MWKIGIVHEDGTAQTIDVEGKDASSMAAMKVLANYVIDRIASNDAIVAVAVIHNASLRRSQRYSCSSGGWINPII